MRPASDLESVRWTSRTLTWNSRSAGVRPVAIAAAQTHLSFSSTAPAVRPMTPDAAPCAGRKRRIHSDDVGLTASQRQETFPATADQDRRDEDAALASGDSRTR